MEFISPFHKDGSAYEIYDTGKAQEITIDENSAEEVKIECRMTRIPADKVTDEMIKDIVKKIQDAVKNGDDTLKGDIGKSILKKLEKNVDNDSDVSEETKKAKEETEKKTDEKPEAKTESTGSAPSAENTQQPSAGNTQSGGNQSAENTQPSQPAHEHVWKEHTATTQEWVPNIVTVEDYGTREVIVGTAIQCNCGAILYGDYEEHMINHILAGEDTGEHTINITETQTVVVGTHTEDHGSYVEKTYVDYYYCDCGATK